MAAREVFRIRDARIYIIGQAFSSFGDAALWLAMGVWVKTLTGSNAAAGLVIFFYTAPTLLAPFAGDLADRFPRRPLLIAVNVFAGLAVLLLLLVKGREQVWLIDLVMVLYGASYVVLAATQSALLTVMLPASLLADANAVLRTIQAALRLAGPLAGAALFVLVGARVITIIDAATFVIAVVALLLLRIAEPPPAPRGRPWREELTGGIRHLAGIPALRQLILATACATAVFGFSETIVYAIAESGLHRPPAFVGVLIAVQGAGAVAGGLTAAAVTRRLGESRQVGIGLIITAAGSLLELPPSLVPVLAGMFLFGLSLPWILVGFTTLIQRRTPAELQGRVYAAAETMASTPQTISIAVGAALIGVLGYRAMLGAMAAGLALAAAYLLTRRGEGDGAGLGGTGSGSTESGAKASR
jgi:Na+/melibiose symporter-like transporter